MTQYLHIINAASTKSRSENSTNSLHLNTLNSSDTAAVKEPSTLPVLRFSGEQEASTSRSSEFWRKDGNFNHSNWWATDTSPAYGGPTPLSSCANVNCWLSELRLLHPPVHSAQPDLYCRWSTGIQLLSPGSHGWQTLASDFSTVLRFDPREFEPSSSSQSRWVCQEDSSTAFSFRQKPGTDTLNSTR